MSRSTRDIIRTGFVESALRAPLTFGETSNIRQAILKKSNIDQFTDTMMEMRIGSQFRKASPELLQSLEEGGGLSEKIQRGIDATTDIRQASDKGGNILPNFRYLTTNYTTAPAIVYGSLGLDYGGAAAKAAVFMDSDTNSVMRAITGQGNFGAKTFIAGGDFSPSYRFAEETVLFVHPNTGKGLHQL
jgi:hypothetical protein